MINDQYPERVALADLALAAERFFAHSLDILCVLDESGRIRSINPAIERTLGYEQQEVIGRHFADFVHADDQFAAMEKLKQLQAGEDTVQFSVRCERKDGSLRWLECTCPALAHDSTSYYVIGRDITNRKQAEDQRDEASNRGAESLDISGNIFATDTSSEQRFRQAIQAAPIGVLMVDTDGIIQFLNPKIEEMFDYPDGELKGQNVDVLVPERFRGQHPQLRQQFCENPVSRVLGEGRHLTGVQKDGSEISVEIGLGPLPTSEGMMIMCTVVDRREYEAAQMAVEQTERLLRDIIDNTSAVIYVKQTTGSYLLVNRRFEDLFGVDRNAIKGRTDYDLFPPELADVFRRNDTAVAQSGTAMQIEEHAPHHDGIHTYLSLKFPLKNTSGDIYAVAGISTDITDRLERQTAEQEMATAQAVQRILYPKSFPTMSRFEIAGAVFPARLLCGDYLDFIPVGDDGWLVAVGDICGHGLGPALQMVGTRAYLRAIVEAEGANLRLHQAMCQLNEFLLGDMQESGFLSLFLVFLNEQASTLHCLGAGHDAILVRNNGSIQRVGSHGGILGITSDLSFDPIEPLQMTSGDILVATTDGVFETMNPDLEPFGRQRLSDIILQHREKSAADILQAVQQSVHSFADGHPKNDDVTISVIKSLSLLFPLIANVGECVMTFVLAL
jgi:PAS domain S-box-containing protein